MFGLFDKFKNGFKKTSQGILSSLGQLFGKKLDEDSIEFLEETFYSADFGAETVEDIISEIKKAYKLDKNIRKETVEKIAKDVLSKILDNSDKKFQPPKIQSIIDNSRGKIEPEIPKTSQEIEPEIIILVGINGAGKTTTAAKLGAFFQKQNYDVILGACDTFRAAANEQIAIWSERLKIDLVSSHSGADSASVAFDTYQAAKNRKKDIVLLDTAGRLHNKSHLMEELAKIQRVLGKYSSKIHKWLVIDGTLGSNSIEQARVFNLKIGISGLIVTKLDGTMRGGAIVSIYRQLGIPIYFVGLGEKIEDLQPFSKDDYINSLFETD